MPGTELRSQDARNGPLIRSPTSLITEHRINAPEPVCQDIPGRSRHSRNGLSLAYNDCPFPDHHCKVNVPGLLLRCLAEPSSGPFGLWLFHPGWFAPTPEQPHRRDPLPDSRPAISVCSSNLRSLLGTFRCPSRSKRSIRFATEKLTFRTRPMALRSPQPILFSFGYGSKFRTRYVFADPFGILFPVARDRVSAGGSYPSPDLSSGDSSRFRSGRLRSPSVTNKPVKPVRCLRPQVTFIMAG
jgi:hypothetical protein